MWRHLAGVTLAVLLAGAAQAQTAPAKATTPAKARPVQATPAQAAPAQAAPAQVALTPAQLQTLADVKAELATLGAQISALRAELVTTGAATGAAGGGDALQRMDAIEAELTKLTAKTEEVDLRLRKVVADGTNRIGDIEFRLCDLTPGCDPSKLPATPVLGGGAPAPAPAPAPAAANQGGGDLAVNEQSDFDTAKKAFDAGDYAGAAALFATFAKTYTGGDLTQQALVLRGDALDKVGDVPNSARSYLQAFSGQPTGPFAGQALTKLGQQLGKLGQTHEACVTLTEVGRRFPGTPDAGNAAAAMQSMGCP